MKYSNDIHPPPMKKSICRQSILYTGYKYWNKIPANIRDCQKITYFRKKLKKNIYYANIKLKCLLLDQGKDCGLLYYSLKTKKKYSLN